MFRMMVPHWGMEVMQFPIQRGQSLFRFVTRTMVKQLSVCLRLVVFILMEEIISFLTIMAIMLMILTFVR